MRTKPSPSSRGFLNVVVSVCAFLPREKYALWGGGGELCFSDFEALKPNPQTPIPKPETWNP